MSKDTPLQQILRKLKSVFPDAVTETKKQGEDGKPYYEYALEEEFIEQLQGAGLDIADDQNRYELQFPGKQLAKAQAFAPSYKTLVADKQQSKNFDDTGNVFIEGDNLDALRILQKSYRGKIKMIYIDPPYNTGGDGFVYNDDFSTEQKKYLESIGALDEEGVRQISRVQDGLRGRFHAGWLAMIYPRLKLARELLSEDGVIFISIDDNEIANLKLICDEIFGENGECYIWRKSDDGRYGKMKNTKTVRNDHEYIFALFKDKNETIFNKIGVYPNFSSPPRKDEKGEWWQGYIARGERGSNPKHPRYYTVKSPSGKEFTAQFEVDIKEFTDLDNSGYIHWSSSGVPYRKMYRDEKRNIVASSVFNDVGTSYSGAQTLESTMEFSDVFNNPKPVELIQRLLELSTTAKDNCFICDFFAGSATTAHAVMQLNAEDGGKRKFIMVQWSEAINKKSKEAYQFCTKELQRPATIAEISKERIRRAGDKILTDNPGKEIDTGFRVFNVCDSLLRSNDRSLLAYTEQTDLVHYKRDLKRKDFERLLYESILYTAIPLDLPVTVHKAAGYPFALCNRYCYCVTENLTQEIVRAIAEQYGDQFDILYYLSDCPKPTTSYTELESAIRLAGDKDIQPLNFY